MDRADNARAEDGDARVVLRLWVWDVSKSEGPTEPSVFIPLQVRGKGKAAHIPFFARRHAIPASLEPPACSRSCPAVAAWPCAPPRPGS